GIQTDLLTQAYNLQRQALLETALDSSDLVDELEKWQQVLWKLKDQIMEMQFSLQNPLDVLERMALLEDEITRMLGDTWQQGILATEGMAAETVEKSSELLGKYLDMAADAFQRPSIEYQEIYGDVLDALMGLEEYAQEQVTDLEIQLEQLEAQLKMVQLLETIVADQVPVIPPSDKTEPVLDGLIGGTPYDPELYKTALSLPELQEGTDYVPRTGPYILHEGEKVTPYGEDGMSISITVNESATPHETAREVKNEFFRLLRSDAGRKEVQQASRGR
ncbi:hypothetical protein KKH23_06145, partial [Patescibacteria group bacterium]|nr:hypothetical protein [Patescibacteria group bacterium]